jgi:hypothetical protein
MRERRLTIPEIMLIAGTRAALGAGVGLLVAGMISDDTRKGAGKALMAVGVLSTIPIAIGIIGKGEEAWEQRLCAKAQAEPRRERKQ